MAEREKKPDGGRGVEGCGLGFRQVAYAYRRGWVGAIRGSFRMIFRDIADSEFDALIRTAVLFKKLASHAAALGLSKGAFRGM